MNDKQRDAAHTTDGKEPTLLSGPAPQPMDPETGQHKAYWVLSDEERAGGFVRPVRETYKHVGRKPKYPLQDLSDEKKKEYERFGYVKFEAYPPDSPESQGGNVTGRYWTEAQLNSGCGTVTRMGRKIAETYAKQPDFYGATFCAGCKTHLPVGEFGEFIWDDGSGERVGT